MDREGRRAKLVVSEDFYNVLDGVSYVDPIKFKGKVGDIREAAKRARLKYPNAKVIQTWGSDWKAPRTTENFQREQWARMGMDRRFEQLSLVFDKRDAGREAKLVADHILTFEDQTKPTLLLSLSAVSTPVTCSETIKAMIEGELSHIFNILDISAIPVERLYDLLGLLDVSACLVTVDTATLHLANASSIPVVALVNTDSWTASLRRPNHIYRSPYNDVEPGAMIDAIRKTSDSFSGSRVVHVHSHHPLNNPEDLARVGRAQESWEEEYKNGLWTSIGVADEAVRTSDKELGDTRRMPYVKDLIEKGFEQAPDPWDIVVLTNSDVGFTDGITQRLRQLCGLKGALFGYRFDFDKVADGPVSSFDVAGGKHLGGLDLVAFTREFWERHKYKFPDSILGSSNWDLHFRDLIKQYRGAELYGSHWHELHPAQWQKLGGENVANAHNTALYRDYLKTRDRTRPYNL